MTDYTAEEIDAAIDSLQDEDSESYDDSSWGSMAYGDGPETLMLRGETVPLVHVIQEGGEGQGDEIWFVFRVGTQLFRKEGYYASHYGSDWDGELYEVVEKQKTVTVYEME